jgi:hypothetical protein
MEEENSQEQHRILPNSDLELNLMITDSTWGRNDVSKELRETLNKYYLEKNKDGKQVITSKSLWGLLNYYTRDMRLANLSEWNGELAACRYYIDLATHLLYAEMIEPFLISLSYAITILETSQSKAGFLRRQMNTLRQEHISQNLEPPKKSFFGGGKPEQGGGR